ALAILNELDNDANGQSRNSGVSSPQSIVGRDKSGSPALSSTPPTGRDKSGPYDEREKPAAPALSPAQHEGSARGKAPASAPQNTVRLEAGMTAGHAVLTLLSADVTAVPGVGTTVAAKLHN